MNFSIKIQFVCCLAICFAPHILCGDDTDRTGSINRLIRLGWAERKIKPAETCTDREFVRRVYLDLVGRVPTIPEVETLLADGRSDKRVHLVDLLLKSEDHVQHFTDLFDTLLMGRAPENKYVQRVQSGWRSYLETALRDDRPWNQVAKEILLARPTDKSQRGSVWFLYERNNEHQAIAESIAPAFFGIRVECAQCHDHMMADEIKQAHYWGLVAFFNRGKNTNSKNGPRIAESAIGGFSDFADLGGGSTPNRLTFFQSPTVEEPRPEKDKKQSDSDNLYNAAKIAGDPRVPKFSRREKFVENVLEGHPLFARAMVNRLWAIMLGRGIVHPFDEMDSVHPPSHPELLDWLTEDFVANGHRVRHTVRRIALSDTYQLSSRRPTGADDPATFAWYAERPLTGEQLARSVQLVLRGGFRNDHPIIGTFRKQFPVVLPDENVVTIGEALFFSNNVKLDAFFKESQKPEHLLGKVSKLETHEDRIDLLFRTILSRGADKDERRAIMAYLEERKDSLDAAVRQVAWSLFNSAEFRFNH